jgi:hypothetical protein
VRRTVATLLVVASPVLLAAPVGAREGRIAAQPAPAAVPAAPVTAPLTAAVLKVAPVAAMPAVPAPAKAVTAVRPAVRGLAGRAPSPAVSDAAYAAHLRADLCQARQIFCGLDQNGRYPAG